MQEYDCVVVGHYETDSNLVSNLRRLTSEQSGAYHEVATNSILFDGRRTSYTQLLNIGLEAATGRKWSLHPLDVPQLGVFYLTSYLRRRGFNVGFVNFCNTDEEKLFELLATARTVAITTTYYITNESIIKLIRRIRAFRKEIRIVAGGPRIFGIYQSVQDKEKLHAQLNAIGADVYVVESQGEQALAALVQAFADDSPDLSGIPNLIVREEGGGMRQTRRMVEENDLNENRVQWNLFKRHEYTPTLFLRTARGCPFSCAFCNYPGFAGPHTQIDIAHLEGELRYLREAGVKNVMFVDDTFNVPLSRFKKILRMMIRNRFVFRWVSFFRCSNSDEEAIELMAESGCTGVYLGTESGDPTILRNMNKAATVKQYRRGIASLSKNNIMTVSSIIVGFPGETEETIQNTLAFLQESGTTFYSVFLYYHDPRAPSNSTREEFGISGSSLSWSHDSMDWKQAIHWKEYLIKNVTGSILLPVHDLSIWSFPYLLQQGLSPSQIKNFFSFGNEHIRASLEGKNPDAASQIEALAGLFPEIN